MSRDNVIRSRPAEKPALKSRELRHTDSVPASTLQPSFFAMQRRLKEMERRQQRAEEMLSAIFLTLEDIRDAVGATAAEPQSAGFRLPDIRKQEKDRRFPMWLRAWYSFWDPQKLRKPGANRW